MELKSFDSLEENDIVRRFPTTGKVFVSIPSANQTQNLPHEEMVATDGVAKERCMEVYNEQKRNIKRCIHQSKNGVNEQFGRKMK